MSALVITPGSLRGRVTVPPSKSIAHRAVIAAALACGRSVISNLELSQDIEATLSCACALGAQTTYDPESMRLTVDGTDTLKVGGDIDLDCGESGSTLRFLMPLALLREGQTRFTGRGRLMERPLGPYEELFSRKGAVFRRENGSVVVSGSLEPGGFGLRGDISSQFVTGLLMALPLLEGNSRIIMTSPLESAPYVDLTVEALRSFGICVENEEYKAFSVPGGQSYTPSDFAVEGDYSQAAFWLVANALGSDIALCGLNPDSLQGDMAITGFISSGEKVLDVSETPDLAPILAVLCCLRPGESKIVGAGRLRLKESDRLSAIASELARLGADIRQDGDTLVINGKEGLCGGHVDSHNDHRIAMALAVAATRCRGEVMLHGPECVAKSYPAFFEHYFMLKGEAL